MSPQGLARISHRDKLRFSTLGKYDHDPEGGEGVDVYVIDTGININHVEFEGRAKWGKTMPANDVDEDGNGTFFYWRLTCVTDRSLNRTWSVVRIFFPSSLSDVE